MLLTVHTHLPHPLSSEELSILPNTEDIYKAVQEALVDNRSESSSFREIWRTREVVLICKGDVKHLFEAFKPGIVDPDEWDVKYAENGWDIEITWNRFGMFAQPACS